MNERPPSLSALRSRSPYLLDGLMALALTALSVATLVTSERTDGQPREADVLGVVLIVLAGAALAFRRRWPVAVFLLVTGGTTAFYVLDYPDSGLPIFVLVALYTLASRGDRRITIVATGALLLVIALVVAPAADMDGGTLAGALAMMVAAATWGDRRKVQEAYSEQLAAGGPARRAAKLDVLDAIAGE